MAKKKSSSSGCVWTKNNLACVNTWAFLRGLGQLKPVFSESGKLKMKELAFWNDAISSTLRRAEAKAVAVQLNQIFRKSLLAKYETGIDATKAVENMTDLMNSGSKTLCQLSVVVDKAYNFRGEIK